MYEKARGGGGHTNGGWGWKVLGGTASVMALWFTYNQGLCSSNVDT